MPQLQTDIVDAYADQGLQAVAISSSIIGPEDPVQLEAYVQGMGLTMPVLLDRDAEVYDDYRIDDPDRFAPYPREYLIDRDGRVLYTSATIDVPALKALLDEVL